MLIAEIVDNIAQQFDKPFDRPFKNRIKSEVLLARARIIEQHFNKYGTYPESLVSQINSTSMKLTDIAESSFTLGKNISRSRLTMPSPIRMSNRNSNFIYVGSPDGRRAYNYIAPENLNDKLKNRFAKDTVWYTYINSYIYVFNLHPANIRIRGVFSNPYRIAELNGCTTENCPQDLNIPEDFGNQIEILVIDIIRGNSPQPDKKEEVEIETDDQ